MLSANAEPLPALGPDTGWGSSLHALDAAPADDGRRRVVLVLGGWSDGPLALLRATFKDRCTFVQPALPMPPVGLRWLWNPYVVLLLAALGVFPSLWAALAATLAASSFFGVLLRVLLVGLLLVACRVLVGRLARYSVHQCVAIAKRRIDQGDVDIVLGFSWGGGVACWLLHEEKWKGAAVILAPTVDAMASAARVSVHGPRSPTHFACAKEPRVHIFHATNDGFCGDAQVERLEMTGAVSWGKRLGKRGERWRDEEGAPIQ